MLCWRHSVFAIFFSLHLFISFWESNCNQITLSLLLNGICHLLHVLQNSKKTNKWINALENGESCIFCSKKKRRKHRFGMRPTFKWKICIANDKFTMFSSNWRNFIDVSAENYLIDEFDELYVICFYNDNAEEKFMQLTIHTFAHLSVCIWDEWLRLFWRHKKVIISQSLNFQNNYCYWEITIRLWLQKMYSYHITLNYSRVLSYSHFFVDFKQDS